MIRTDKIVFTDSSNEKNGNIFSVSAPEILLILKENKELHGKLSKFLLSFIRKKSTQNQKKMKICQNKTKLDVACSAGSKGLDS